MTQKRQQQRQEGQALAGDLCRAFITQVITVNSKKCSSLRDLVEVIALNADSEEGGRKFYKAVEDVDLYDPGKLPDDLAIECAGRITEINARPILPFLEVTYDQADDMARKAMEEAGLRKLDPVRTALKKNGADAFVTMLGRALRHG